MGTTDGAKVGHEIQDEDNLQQKRPFFGRTAKKVALDRFHQTCFFSIFLYLPVFFFLFIHVTSKPGLGTGIDPGMFF